MSNVARVAGQAANTLVKPLNVEDVFSTYLYDGNGSTQTITNGVDLSGEGGLVWIKTRNFTYDHSLHDTERGANNHLESNTANAAVQYGSGGLNAFNSSGFSVQGGNDVNNASYDYASWTFRKAPKFFDVVTYTGDSVAGRTISHNLGSVPGMIIIKNLGVAVPWAVYHRGMHPTPENYYMNLNENFARAASSSYWNNTAPTSTTVTLGNANRVNATGSNYVAYLFAHNDGDAEFGPTGDQDIIKCGSYTNDSSNDVYVDLGWEPQWVLVKNASSSGDWNIVDNMRGLVSDETNNLSKELNPNTSVAETSIRVIQPTSTGFYVQNAIDGNYNENTTTGTKTHIYIAIRRGSMAVPESATDVFATETQGATTPNPPAFTSGFVVDAALFKQTNGATNWHLAPRLTQNKYMFTDTSDSEQTNSTYDFDFNNGWLDTTSVQSAYRSWMWKRAPNYFDVVCYTGNGSAGHTVSHNLGVAPEMMWVKRRNGTGSWAVYHAGIASDAETDYIYLDYNFSAGDDATFWNDTAPTASDFTLGNGGGVNSNNQTYIAYLFASLAGISKVGSYTGNNTSQTIDCGFSAGARFVIIKRTDFSGSWYLWDSARGIVAGNDPYLLLDTNAAEVSSYDWIDPDNSGFIVNSTTVNASSGNYIFYAIA